MLPLATGCRRLRRLDLTHVCAFAPLFWRRLREEGAGAVALESVRLGFGELAYCGSAVWTELPAIAAELTAMKPLNTLTLDCGWERWGGKQAVAAMPDFCGRAAAAGLVRWANGGSDSLDSSGSLEPQPTRRDLFLPEVLITEMKRSPASFGLEVHELERQPQPYKNRRHWTVTSVLAQRALED